MFTKITFFCVLVSFPLMEAAIPNLSHNSDNAIDTNQQKFKIIGSRKSQSLLNYTITHNPMVVTGDALLDELCGNNVDGNYMNPFNCSQIIMCSNGEAVLCECEDGAYNPLEDKCVYKGSPAAQCPWRSTWYDPDNINCKNTGIRPWWSDLTLPKNPRECCGEDIYYCNKAKKVGKDKKCPPGFGFSKAFFACLNYRTCKSIDDYLKLTNIS